MNEWVSVPAPKLGADPKCPRSNGTEVSIRLPLYRDAPEYKGQAFIPVSLKCRAARQARANFQKLELERMSPGNMASGL
ncbi:hypothetical protein FOXB_10652 [Fusarium oxysporum f. sp. conglutinans Fo5176]|uniref:Uncharacterized protein n=1 Tax=Fusarium oxysporum (strain Fo5176) TaxID=660025 RepID=F9FW70_FUSOF|nr:hypothetical protein FOXB_10652 [Fusarium oxysporum f. sp. conglutinans Fo5176]